MLKVGEMAPDFSGTAQDGRTVKLSELRGKRAVLFFFPKAFTTGCTIETRQFRDHYTELAALGAEVIGLSVDSSEKQCELDVYKRQRQDLRRRLAAGDGGPVSDPA